MLNKAPPDNAPDIHDLLRFLWFGKHFRRDACDAVQAGQARLASFFAEVRWIRDRFSSDGNPAGNRRFSSDDVTKIHNACRDSMCWMTAKTWEKYQSLLQQPRKGANQEAHQLMKRTFNVYCFQRFGSKALFFHIVKTGTRDLCMPELLHARAEFKRTAAYKDLLASSAAKSAEERKLKHERGRLRFALLQKRRLGASADVIQRLLQELEDAKAAYVATGRARRHQGVAEHLV